MSDEEIAEIVYRWEGPPAIQLSRRHVTPPTGVPFELHELTVQDGRPGAVIVATRDDSILFVHHYRPALGELLVELPRGFAELADSGALTTGVREFSEELGLPLVEARLIGEYIVDTSIYPTRVGVITGELPMEALPGDTDGEISDWMLIPVREVQGWIRRREIHDAHTLSALAVFFATLEG